MLFDLVLLTFPIQSFVITNVIKGLTPFNFFMIILIIKNLILVNKKFIKQLLLFLMVFFIYSFLQQLANFFIHNYNPFLNKLIYISHESFLHLSYRRSLITQSLYLVICVSFFFLLLEYLKIHSKEKVINLSYIAIIIFVLYGYYEFFFYMITGMDPDFISNRITGKDFHYGLFQTLTINGIRIMRMKSLSGEPSMFAYTLIPFFVLSLYLKRFKTFLFLFITLIICTSTTAILGILVFMIFNIIYEKNRIVKLVLFFSVLGVFIYYFWDYISFLYKFTMAKINMQNTSGIQRFDYFYNHFNAWLHSDIIHILIGYGWGYVRSTDGISTLLFNTGIIGTLTFSFFMILPYFLIKKKNDYIRGLYIANFTTLIVILLSVPEFYYPHVWLISGLLWYEYLKYLRNK